LGAVARGPDRSLLNAGGPSRGVTCSKANRFQSGEGDSNHIVNSHHSFLWTIQSEGPRYSISNQLKRYSPLR